MSGPVQVLLGFGPEPDLSCRIVQVGNRRQGCTRGAWNRNIRLGVDFFQIDLWTWTNLTM